MTRKSQEELEERLNRLLLEIADIQDRIWDGLEALQRQGMLSPEAEEHVSRVMKEVSFWVDQCTLASESPPVLLQRMDVQLARLVKIEALIRLILENIGLTGAQKSASVG